MKWKALPYWLKGGISILIFLLTIYLIASFGKIVVNGGKCDLGFGPSPPVNISYCFQGIILSMIMLIPTIFLLLFNMNILEVLSKFNVIWIMYAILIWFLIGSLIGFLYGRIRKKYDK